MAKILKISWNNLKTMWSECERCALHKHRKRVVFGKGLRDADVFLIGEAPGKDEDIMGVPFVGKIGRLLRAMLERAGMSPDSIYISNTCICRPYKNRMPQVDEVKACFSRLKMEIELVKPRFIIFCGSRAATIQSIDEAYFKFFAPYYTYSMFHPGSIRHVGSSRRTVIENQIANFVKDIRKRGGKFSA